METFLIGAFGTVGLLCLTFWPSFVVDNNYICVNFGYIGSLDERKPVNIKLSWVLCVGAIVGGIGGAIMI